MTAEQFWKDDPQLFVAYRISFINKKKREMEELDYKCWLQGLYNYDGTGKLTQMLIQFLGNMVSKNKKLEPIESYPDLPYFEKKKKQEEHKVVIETKSSDNYKQYENDLHYYGSLKERYLANLNKHSK